MSVAMSRGLMIGRSAQALLIAGLLAYAGSPCLAGGGLSYLHRLSDFNGPIPFDFVRLAVDQRTEEVYVDDGENFRVFNAAGMEVYRFAHDPSYGVVRGLVVDDDGGLYLLSWELEGSSHPGPGLLHCNYRGEVLERAELTGLPVALAGFAPDGLYRLGEHLLLVSRSQMLAAEVDRRGAFRKAHDLGQAAEVAPEDRKTTEIESFSVDPAGRMLFTVPVMFRAFVIDAGGQVSSFGKAGSIPGAFGIVSGIGADASGRIYVTDKLRSVLMVYDAGFRFVGEAGQYGNRPENLVRPGDLVIAGANRILVTQAGRRGVSVFAADPIEP